MELLVFGDSHIKPVENAIDYEHLEVPPDVDVIVSIGDVIHDARENAIDYGHEFFERLASFEVPVLAIPGNHDPVEYYPDLTADLSSVVTTHKQMVTASTTSILAVDEQRPDDTRRDGHRNRPVPGST